MSNTNGRSSTKSYKSGSPQARRYRVINLLILGMALLYLLFLIWAILWKCGMPYVGGGEQVINLTPFLGNARWELEFNIAVFIPFGFYLAAVTSRRGLPMKLLVTLVVSLLLEFMQFVLAIGRSDVTDLMMNVVGGAIGIVAYYLFAWMLRKRERVPTLVVCLLLTLFEFYMTISFIFFGQLDIGFMIVKLN